LSDDGDEDSVARHETDARDRTLWVATIVLGNLFEEVKEFEVCTVLSVAASQRSVGEFRQTQPS
jgi:hypothetical protein